MKVYIAGKITGEAGYKEKFASAAAILEGSGHIVLNPAVLPAGMAEADYMRICMAMMESADAVMFLPDWICSRGACLEHQWCEYTGKAIMYA